MPRKAMAQESKDEISITGKVIGYDLKTNNLIELIFDDILEDRINIVSQLDTNGNFTFSLDRPYSQVGLLIVGDNGYSFFAAPGDSQHLEINYVKDEIYFEGSHAQFNDQLSAYIKFINNSQPEFTVRDSMLKTSGPMEYQTYIYEKEAYFTQILNNFFKENNCSPEFKAWVSLDRKYWSMTELMQYCWLHPTMNKINRDSFLRFIPSEYYAFLEDPKLLERSGLQDPFFYYFLNEYYSFLLSDPELFDSSPKVTKLNEKGDELSLFQTRAKQPYFQKSPFAQDLLSARLYYQLLSEGNTIAFDSLKKLYPIHEEKLMQLLLLKYKKVKDLEKLPENPSRIRFIEGVENIEQEILSYIVEQHKGKVLYIDFWATWCMPCMAEVPYAKRMKEQVDPEKVVFIYLAIKCEKESWKISAANQEMQGEHYLLTDAQFKAISKQFQFSTIPRYFLIDQNGEVVDSNAPKPRESKQIMEAINKLLENE